MTALIVIEFAVLAIGVVAIALIIKALIDYATKS